VPLDLETAHYEAQRAWRPYDLVDPAHRLVAGALAHRWHEDLERVTEVATPRATLQSQQSTLREEPRHG